MELDIGDVVLISFPYTTDSGEVQERRRPAVVVKCTPSEVSSTDVLIAPITADHAAAGTERKVTILSDSPEGKFAGLRIDSVIDCNVVASVPRKKIVNRIGKLFASTMTLVQQLLTDENNNR